MNTAFHIASMPLIDGFGRTHRYLRVSVTDRCDLKCSYCMPTQAFQARPREEILTLEEILRVASLCVDMGVTKIRLTGGEPTVRKDLAWLVGALAELPELETLGMTTNGVLLGDQAEALREAGLQSVNISLDTLRAERFARIAGVDRLSDVLHGLDRALEAGLSPVKVNVVVIAGVNDDELTDFVDFARERPVNVRFIEFMPFVGNGWSADRWIPWKTMRERIGEHGGLTSCGSSRGVARDFTVDSGAGQVSFISPLSEDFCARCNRLRLTADGAIKSCLLHPAEVNLRTALRDGTPEMEIAMMIRRALLEKQFEHPPECALLAAPGRSMPDIGG
jgi:cyclic pyranopterin phosphate synthase